MYEYRCDERILELSVGLNVRDFSVTPHIHWVEVGTGTPKDRDEVNRQEVCECDG